MSTPDDLLTGPAVDAAVTALAERNAHHFEAMSEEDRREAIATWRDLAVAVLTAARAASGGPEGDPELGGRAVVVFEDAAPEQVAVHVSLFPQPQETPEGDVLVTPAQAAALELLEGIAPEDGEPQG